MMTRAGPEPDSKGRSPMKPPRRSLALLLAVSTLAALGCATKKYVKKQVGEEVSGSEARSAERFRDVEARLEENQTRLGEQDEKMGELSQTARDALERAIAAGKLAEGKFLYETVLSDDKVRFGFDQADLSGEAKAALDDFAAGLKLENANVYVEVQGHTDSVGSDEYNLRLGERRAESVRRYLNLQHGLPLHRMSVISYGESVPAADNATRDGRALNRRVVLVVLK